MWLFCRQETLSRLEWRGAFPDAPQGCVAEVELIPPALEHLPVIGKDALSCYAGRSWSERGHALVGQGSRRGAAPGPAEAAPRCWLEGFRDRAPDDDRFDARARAAIENWARAPPRRCSIRLT